MKKINLIISGGGTAGHIYPALTIAQIMQQKAPEINPVFVGSTRALEKKIMEHHKANFIPLKIEGLKGKGIKTFRSLLILPYAFFKCLMILIKFRPKLVIGVGGYSSGPIVLLAAFLKIPTMIMEQNVKPGFTNKLLIPWIKKAVVAFESSLPYFKNKAVFLGNPVRSEFYNLTPKQRNNNLTLLIFGGSQGSLLLNKSMTEALPLLLDNRESLKIYHQTGENDWQWVKKSYEDMEFSQAKVAPYFYNMADYFQKSDLIICRAGATTIAELIAAQKASLLIPFAKASDNHQVLNAKEVEKMGGADIIFENELTPQKLADRILYFIKNQERIDQMEENLAILKTKNVAEKISELCFELMDRRKRRSSSSEKII